MKLLPNKNDAEFEQPNSLQRLLMLVYSNIPIVLLFAGLWLVDVKMISQPNTINTLWFKSLIAITLLIFLLVNLVHLFFGNKLNSVLDTVREIMKNEDRQFSDNFFIDFYGAVMFLLGIGFGITLFGYIFTL